MLNKTVGNNHYIAQTIKSNKYKKTIEQLCAIRNYAAHTSIQSKKAAMEAFDLQRISSAGSCLKKQQRLEKLVTALRELASVIKQNTQADSN